MKNLVKSVIAGSMVVASLGAVAVNATSNEALTFNTNAAEEGIYNIIIANDMRNVCEAKVICNPEMAIVQDDTDNTVFYAVNKATGSKEKFAVNPAGNNELGFQFFSATGDATRYEQAKEIRF